MPTKDEILNMPAGREMDKRIIELLEIRISDYPDSNEPTDHYPPAFWNRQRECWCIFWEKEQDAEPFLPSTDIAAAWQVMEWMREHTVEKYTAPSLFSVPHGWSMVLYEKNDNHAPAWLDAFAPTAPLAICRAALLAVMDGDE
jgi:hypothetical protein